MQGVYLVVLYLAWILLCVCEGIRAECQAVATAMGSSHDVWGFDATALHTVAFARLCVNTAASAHTLFWCWAPGLQLAPLNWGREFACPLACLCLLLNSALCTTTEAWICGCA